MRSVPQQYLLLVLSTVGGPAGVWTAFLWDPKPLHLWESADPLGQQRSPGEGSFLAARHDTDCSVSVHCNGTHKKCSVALPSLLPIRAILTGGSVLCCRTYFVSHDGSRASSVKSEFMRTHEDFVLLWEGISPWGAGL